MPTDEKISFLKELNVIIVGLAEIDQECAVLDTIYREQSKTRIVSRIDETIGSLMRMKENVKAMQIDQYKGSKYATLIKDKDKNKE